MVISHDSPHPPAHGVGRAETARVGQDSGAASHTHSHTLSRVFPLLPMSPCARGMCPGGGGPWEPPGSGAEGAGPCRGHQYTEGPPRYSHAGVPCTVSLWPEVSRAAGHSSHPCLCWTWASPVFRALQPLKALPFPQAWPGHEHPRAGQVGLVGMEGLVGVGDLQGSWESCRAQGGWLRRPVAGSLAWCLGPEGPASQP